MNSLEEILIEHRIRQKQHQISGIVSFACIADGVWTPEQLKRKQRLVHELEMQVEAELHRLKLKGVVNLRYPNLEAELARRKIRRHDLAKMLDMSLTKINAKMTGKKEFTLDEAATIKFKLGLNMPLETLFYLDREDGNVAASSKERFGDEQ